MQFIESVKLAGVCDILSLRLATFYSVAQQLIDALRSRRVALSS